MFLGWPSTKLAQTVSLQWTKWSPKLKVEKKTTFKWLLLLNRWKDFEIMSQECFMGHPQPKYLNCSARLNKMATRAKNRKPFKQMFLLNRWMFFFFFFFFFFFNNFTWIFLRWPATKIVAQTVPLQWTRWPPVLRIEKYFSDFSS